MEWLDQFPELEELDIDGHSWAADTRAIYARIGRAKKLRRLTVGVIDREEIVELLRALPNLEFLKGTTRTDALSGERIGGGHKLREMDLTFRHMFAAGDDQAVLRGFPNLAKLTASFENIWARLAIEDLPSLEVADIYVAVPIVDLRRLPKLKDLKITANALAEVRVEQVPSLESASFSSLKIRGPFDATCWPNARLQFAAAPALRKLSCSGVRLMRDPTLELPSLEDLSLFESSLPELSGAQWSRLKRLEVQNESTKMPDVDQVAYEGFWNRATALDRLEALSVKCYGLTWKEAASRYPRLQKLELWQDNPNRWLAIRGLPELRELNVHCSDGVIGIDVEDLSKLETLGIDKPAWKRACRFVNLRQLPRLHTVRVSVGDDLTGPQPVTDEGLADQADWYTLMTFDQAPSLHSLYAARVAISPDDWRPLDALETLSLFDSPEPRLTLAQWANLKTVELDRCSLSWRTILGLLWAKNLKSRQIVLSGMPDEP
jgi:hypothetical protein